MNQNTMSTEKHISEPLGNGVALYSTESGKIQMIGYAPGNPDKDCESDRILRVRRRDFDRRRLGTAIERAMERLSPQCSVCLEFNGSDTAHQWFSSGDDYFNICITCLSETLLKDGSAIPDWVWSCNPKYGYGQGALLCRFVRQYGLTKDFLRCFDGRVPAAIMRATFKNDYGYCTRELVNSFLQETI